MSFKPKLPLIALAVVLPALAPARGQESGESVAEQIEALREGQEQIRRDIQEIRRLLRARGAPPAPAPARVPSGPEVAGKIFDLGENPVRGAGTARLVLVEFTDYQ